MRSKRLLTLVVLTGFAAAGCDDAAKRTVRVRPPAENPVPEMPAGLLPLARQEQQTSLLPAPRSGLDILVEEVQAAFASGEQNYKAGHLDKARRDFDRALDWLLMSGYDLHSDPRLENLFDHIVDTVHAQEIAAFREGDGFTEQRSEPAAIDEIADLTFPVDSRMKLKVEGELRDVPHDLPLTLNDPVLSYLNFFQTPRGRAIVASGLRRSGRYREMIARIFREEGLPQDLIYLAQAESAFQPAALSRAGARGVWQFMSYSARNYGLGRTWWLDDRQDVEKSTRAAARYLRDLYQIFGDWYLAMAAYNTGPAGVARAIERTGYADFWELHKRNALPRETRNYVPIILALTLIAKEPARYGIEFEPEAPVRADRVKPGHPIDLRLVAETIDESVDTLKALNPQLLRMVTPRDSDYELLLPEGSAERFFAEIAAIPAEKWVLWRRHRVEEGETLSGIAHKFRVEPRAIAEANGLDPRAELQEGDKLIIPANKPADTGTGKLVRYRVRRGDTLQSVAGQFNVSPAELRQWNSLRSDGLLRGMTLKVYPGGRPTPAAASLRGKSKRGKIQPEQSSIGPDPAAGQTRHAVKQGESLWSIAQAYHTTVEALRAANQSLSSRPLQVGEILLVPQPR
jgi:membrane-bound lytic murein transglycosylase D